ncbi:sensor histidine kinase [Hyalangium rubrum]|uniref:histidine kinase n=1 Tax=Hyalangium rubrum TaxID=3103134 RepID=A0ABU5HEL7_9BACT|nr:ATP-binding protein [Hyalangium sp. s54d21]MDY7231920.1 ATP-binding protein [Hyalangium sp. s54d21]
MDPTQDPHNEAPRQDTPAAPEGRPLRRRELQANEALQLLSRVGRLLSVRRGSLRLRLQKALRAATSYELATFGLLDLIRADGQLHRVVAVHRNAESEAHLRAVPGHYRPDTACSPIHEVLHTGLSRLFVDYPLEVRRMVGSLPEHLARLEEHQPRSLLVVPLSSRGRVLGLMLLARSEPLPPYRTEDLEIAEELARRLVAAIDSARMRRKAQRAERRARFLSRASQALAASLDYRVTLDRVARLAVPTVADLCTVDILEEDGSIRRLAVAHRAPEKAAVAWELEHRWPSRLEDSFGPGKVIRSGRPELRGEVPDAKLPLAARDTEHLRTLRTLELESYLVAPLQARGRTLGAITFAYTGSHRRYRKADLHLAMELADRAALAVDNALLYRASQEAVRLRDEFLAVASHELKTPLTPLALRLQSLRRELDRGGAIVNPTRLREHVAALQRQSKRLSTLVESLLDVSRLEAGRLELNLEFVDLSALVREVIGRFAAQALRTSTELEVRAEEPVVGRWDRIRLEQVVSSLLSNALKYGVGRPIHIRAERSPTGARLVVKDEGIGISPEHLPRIFDRFERAVSAEHFGGLGLGLYLTRHLVEAFGGTIRAASEPGQGATFEVNLPLASPEA